MSDNLATITAVTGLTTTVAAAINPYAGMLTIQGSLPMALGNALADVTNGQQSNVSLGEDGTIAINGAVINFTARLEQALLIGGLLAGAPVSVPVAVAMGVLAIALSPAVQENLWNPDFWDEVTDTVRNSANNWIPDVIDANNSGFVNWARGFGSSINDIEQSVADFFRDAARFIQPILQDPLTLDLDGDGLETVGTSAGILFDQTGSGVKQGTGWVKADDGFLVLDRNGNGVIDSGRELFGDSTIKSNGQTALDGFDALADLDSNADGKITSADTRFGNLRVLIESAGQHESWTTTGVSTDVIGASWRALIDAIEYKLMRDKAWAGC